MNNTDSNGMIFVFGSNLAGRHGAGAALYARKYYGAEYGNGVGMQGNSYAIPTKDERIKPLPLQEIKRYVDRFIQFAKDNQHLKFQVTQVGCGLAKLDGHTMANLFQGAPLNCFFDSKWELFLGDQYKYWGTYP